MNSDQDTRRKRPALLRWLPETALVVGSVALGFGAAEYGQYPAHRHASARLLWLTLADIHAAEEILLELYGRHLPTLQDAAQSRRE